MVVVVRPFKNVVSQLTWLTSPYRIALSCFSRSTAAISIRTSLRSPSSFVKLPSFIRYDQSFTLDNFRVVLLLYLPDSFITRSIRSPSWSPSRRWSLRTTSAIFLRSTKPISIRRSSTILRSTSATTVSVRPTSRRTAIGLRSRCPPSPSSRWKLVG